MQRFRLALFLVSILFAFQPPHVWGLSIDQEKIAVQETEEQDNKVDELEDQLDNPDIFETEDDKRKSVDNDVDSDVDNDVAQKTEKRSPNSFHSHLLPSWMTMKYLTNAYVRANLKGMITEKLQREQQARSELDRIKADDCHGMILKSVGDPVTHNTYGVHTQGSWMKDPLQYLGAGKIWVMDGYTGKSVVKEFASYNDFKVSIVSKSHQLPCAWDGTGAVVYGPYLYFNKAATNHIIKYDLRDDRQVISRAHGYYNRVRSYYYQWTGFSGMDFAVDESGLWVLSGYSGYGGRLAAAMINPGTLVTHHAWDVKGETQRGIGNAFVACGVVYMVDTYNGNPTRINYAFDTKTKKSMHVNIPFKWQFGYGASLSYNPTEKLLYAWDNFHQMTYSLQFSKKA